MASPIVISILANASQANRTLDQTATRTQKVGGAFRKMAVPAVAALGAIVVAGKKAADAAVEDAESQTLLATSLRKTTGATDKQVAATERFIDKTSRAVGVADDQLRPAMTNLARATGSTSKAQDLLGTALDISAETGADVVSVSKALAKGYSGNTTALGKLLPGIDKNILATKDMTKITDELARLTGGKAVEASKTEAGQRRKSKVAMDESIETIGARLIPIYEKSTAAIASAANFLAKHEKATTIAAAAIGGLALAVTLVNAAMKVGAAVNGIYTLAQKAMGTSAEGTATSLNKTRIGAGLAGVALIGLAQSGAVGEGGLKKVTTAAGAAAIGFSLGGPFGAVVGAGAVLLGIGEKSAASAAQQEKFRAVQQKINSQASALTQTLNEQTGAITKATKVTLAKSLADSGAYSAATKVGVSFDTVTEAALGNKEAQRQVAAATADYTRKALQNAEGIDGLSRASRNAKAVTDPLTLSVRKFSGELGHAKTSSSQANEAIRQMSDRAKSAGGKMNTAGGQAGRGFYNGVHGWLQAISDLGSTIGNRVTSGVRRSLTINSPSKVMTRLGSYTGEGFALGIKRSTPMAVDAMRDTARKTAKAAEFTLGTSGLSRVAGDLSGIPAGGRVQVVNNTFEMTFRVDNRETEAQMGARMNRAINAALRQGLVTA